MSVQAHRTRSFSPSGEQDIFSAPDVGIVGWVLVDGCCLS